MLELKEKGSILKNWGGNLDYGTDEIAAPESVAELAELVRKNRIRPIGTRHSFSNLVPGDGILVSAAGLAFEPEIDRSSGTVTVAAAARYGELAIFLEQNQLALKNMGSLPHISIAGACATGTHGSGDQNQILSSSVRAFSFISATGKLISYRRGDENFEALRLGLGAYGLWVSVTLDVVPSYSIRQDVYRDIPWENLYQDLTSITSAGYSVSLFTKWGSETIDQTWVKSLVTADSTTKPLWGVMPQTQSLAELAPGVGDNLTEQGGVSGPWLDRLPHFRLDKTPSAGNEIQTEYFINREHAVAAIHAVHEVADQVNQPLIISEIRTIARDDAWLSPMNRGDQVALHFTFENNLPAVMPVVNLLERVLAPFAPIPHWGKLHGVSAKELGLVHPHLARAKAVFDELDPEGKFATDYLRRLGVRS